MNKCKAPQHLEAQQCMV